MDQSDKGNSPFTDALIDLGKTLNPASGGFNFNSSGLRDASGDFNAEEAISDVFGGFFSPPTDPAFPPTVTASVPPPPTSNPAHSFKTGGFSEPPPPFQKPGDGFGNGFNGSHSAIPCAPHSTYTSAFGAPIGFHPSRPPHSLNGGPKSVGFMSDLRPPSDGFVGFMSDHRPPSDGFRRPLGGSFGRRGRRGGDGRPFSGDHFVSTANGARPSGGDRSGPQDSPLRDSGFGRTNDDIALLASRSRSSGRRGKGGGRRCGKRRGGREHGITRASGSSAVTEEPKEVPESPLDTTIKRQREISQSSETPMSKRRRVSCEKCGKLGHSTDGCYCKNKESIRCYNCNQLGHLAVRCPQPPQSGRGGRIRGPRPENGRRELMNEASHDAPFQKGYDLPSHIPSDTNNNLEAMGAEIICKLMQDAQMRKETQLRQPQLYDDMLSFMLKQVNL